MRLVKGLGLVILFLVTFCFGLWGSGAIWFQTSGWIQSGLLGVWGLMFVFVLWGITRKKGRRRAVVTLGILIVAIMGWWATITPQQDLDWVTELTHSATGTIDGDQVTLDTVRNFDWHTPTDFTPNWEQRRYDLTQLGSVDMILSYWGDENIAHTLVTFGFDDGQHVTFSVEIKRENGENYSTLGGFYKRFELTVIAADENDIVRLRTHVRDPREDVYLYPLITTAAHRQALFRGYVNLANDLAEKPRFYHTLAANCTTVILALVRNFRDDIKLDTRMIFSGQLPEYMADRKALNWPLPYGNIRERAAISAKALAMEPGENIYVAIRK